MKFLVSLASLTTFILATPVIGHATPKAAATADIIAGQTHYVNISSTGSTMSIKLSCTKGSCTGSIGTLKAGEYTFALTNATGAALKLKTNAKLRKKTANVSLSITTPTGLAKTKAPATPTVINKQLNQSAPNFSGKATLPAGNGYTMTIVWTWLDGGVTAEDDWEAPNV